MPYIDATPTNTQQVVKTTFTMNNTPCAKTSPIEDPKEVSACDGGEIAGGETVSSNLGETVVVGVEGVASGHTSKADAVGSTVSEALDIGTHACVENGSARNQAAVKGFVDKEKSDVPTVSNSDLFGSTRIIHDRISSCENGDESCGTNLIDSTTPHDCLGDCDVTVYGQENVGVSVCAGAGLVSIKHLCSGISPSLEAQSDKRPDTNESEKEVSCADGAEDIPRKRAVGKSEPSDSPDRAGDIGFTSFHQDKFDLRSTEEVVEDISLVASSACDKVFDPMIVRNGDSLKTDTEMVALAAVGIDEQISEHEQEDLITNFLLNLPTDTLHGIASFLPPSGWKSMSCTSKHARRACAAVFHRVRMHGFKCATEVVASWMAGEQADAKELAGLYISSGVPIYPPCHGHGYQTITWRMRAEAIDRENASSSPSEENSTGHPVNQPTGIRNDNSTPESRSRSTRQVDRFYLERGAVRERRRLFHNHVAAREAAAAAAAQVQFNAPPPQHMAPMPVQMMPQLNELEVGMVGPPHQQPPPQRHMQGVPPNDPFVRFPPAGASASIFSPHTPRMTYLEEKCAYWRSVNTGEHTAEDEGLFGGDPTRAVRHLSLANVAVGGPQMGPLPILQRSHSALDVALHQRRHSSSALTGFSQQRAGSSGAPSALPRPPPSVVKCHAHLINQHELSRCTVLDVPTSAGIMDVQNNGGFGREHPHHMGDFGGVGETGAGVDDMVVIPAGELSLSIDFFYPLSRRHEIQAFPCMYDASDFEDEERRHSAYVSSGTFPGRNMAPWASMEGMHASRLRPQFYGERTDVHGRPLPRGILDRRDFPHDDPHFMHNVADPPPIGGPPVFRGAALNEIEDIHVQHGQAMDFGIHPRARGNHSIRTRRSLRGEGMRRSSSLGNLSVHDASPPPADSQGAGALTCYLSYLHNVTIQSYSSTNGKSSLARRFNYYRNKLTNILQQAEVEYGSGLDISFDDVMFQFWDEFFPLTKYISHHDGHTAVPRLDAVSLKAFLTRPCPKSVGIVQCEIERIRVNGGGKKGFSKNGNGDGGVKSGVKGRLFPQYEYRLFIRDRRNMSSRDGVGEEENHDEEESPRNVVLMSAKNRGRNYPTLNSTFLDGYLSGGESSSHSSPHQQQKKSRRGVNNYFLSMASASENPWALRGKENNGVPSLILGRLQSNLLGTEFQIFSPAWKPASPPRSVRRQSQPSLLSSSIGKGSVNEVSSKLGSTSTTDGSPSLISANEDNDSHDDTMSGRTPVSFGSSVQRSSRNLRGKLHRRGSWPGIMGRSRRTSRRAIAHDSSTSNAGVGCVDDDLDTWGEAVRKNREVENGAITYTANLLGNRPRIMDVCIPKLSAVPSAPADDNGSSGSGGSVSDSSVPGPAEYFGGEWERYRERLLREGNLNPNAEVNLMLTKFKQLQERLNNPRSNNQNNNINAADGDNNREGEREEESSPDDGEDFGLLALQNRPPWWNTELGAFVLNFGGRVSVASVKNFQLCDRNDQDYIMLQFGRIHGRHAFTMDFRYPLSAVQAFAIAISSLQSKISLK